MKASGPRTPYRPTFSDPQDQAKVEGEGGDGREKAAPMLASVAWLWQYHSCPAITCRSRPTLSDPQQQAQGRAPFLLLYHRRAGRRAQERTGTIPYTGRQRRGTIPYTGRQEGTGGGDVESSGGVVGQRTSHAGCPLGTRQLLCPYRPQVPRLVGWTESGILMALRRPCTHDDATDLVLISLGLT